MIIDHDPEAFDCRGAGVWTLRGFDATAVKEVKADGVSLRRVETIFDTNQGESFTVHDGLLYLACPLFNAPYCFTVEVMS